MIIIDPSAYIEIEDAPLLQIQQKLTVAVCV